MDHLTNLYKHKCEQLQEQINNLKRMLSEADAPQNEPGYSQPKQLPDGHWYSPKPTTPIHNFQPWDERVPKPQYPVWEHDGDPGDGWDGYWPDAPEGDPRGIPPTVWPRQHPFSLPTYG